MLFQSSVSENQGLQNWVEGQKSLVHVKDILLYNDKRNSGHEGMT